MALGPGHALDHLTRASAEKWQVIGDVVKEKDWRPFIKLCLILLLVQVPFDIGIAWMMFK